MGKPRKGKPDGDAGNRGMPDGDAGVRCRKCGCRHCPVVYTRHKTTHTFRRRQCRHCGHRFSTREKLS